MQIYYFRIKEKQKRWSPIGRRITFRKPSEGSLQDMKRGLVKKDLRLI